MPGARYGFVQPFLDNTALGSLSEAPSMVCQRKLVTQCVGGVRNPSAGT